MADLQVQPKKSGSILPWILLAAGIAALIFFLSRGFRNGAEEIETAADTVGKKIENTAVAGAAIVSNTWDDIDFDAPEVDYDEITDDDIQVRGNDRYGIYVLGENILFDQGKATLRSGAEKNMKMIASSLQKRYNEGNVRIYGYTDNTGDAAMNKQLAEQRAETVRNWLVQNANISDTRISLHPIGEAKPVGSNSTAGGRQQNRRVEIVARN